MTKKETKSIQFIQDMTRMICEVKEEETVKKINNFVNLLMKANMKNERITFREKNGIKNVYIREGRLTYVPDNPNSIEVTFTGYFVYGGVDE